MTRSAFRANAMPTAAALALTAGLFHAFNHMLFKSVLFFGAGAVLGATGLSDIERLGGLIHRMPISSAAFLVASMAIAALPPLNGFASEWLLFQAIFVSPSLPQWGLKLMVPAVGTLLALAAALVVACFVRAFGILYLGRPRGPEAEAAQETDRFSLAAMIMLCALALLAGLLPGVVIDALAPAVQSVAGARMPPQFGGAWTTIVPIADRNSSYNGLMIGLFLVIVAWGMIAFIVALVAGSTQLSSIAATMLTYEVSLRVSLAMALIALIIVALAENARIPVDNPATHLELTMVHEAMVLEYSGRHLAMIDLAAAVKLLLYASLLACLFVPPGLAPGGSGLAAHLIGLVTYIVKVAGIGVMLALFETSIAKMRVFRVPGFLGAALMLGFLGTILLFVSRSL